MAKLYYKGVLEIISAIERRVEASETINANESESALLAIGQVGSSRHGAVLLLLRSPRAVKSVANAAFDRQRVSIQLAAVRALVNIARKKMSGEAEESLRGLIGRSLLYGDIGRLLLSLLQRRTKIRFAAYRLISALVARPWCLMEICSKQEIIKIVTDASMEDTKIVMEARKDCCLSIHQALPVSSNLKSDPAVAGIISKLLEAVKRSRPTITTEQRF